mgnify:CR=1 FL=1
MAQAKIDSLSETDITAYVAELASQGKYNQSNPIKVYGDNTITSKDKAVIRRMAAYIGVSYTALVIRLRDMGLFEYHNILEYISNELNLGGVSQ